MRFFRRKQQYVYDPYEWNALATYNSEVARGIMHTGVWVDKMRLEQERFDKWQRERWEAEGKVILQDGDNYVIVGSPRA